MQEIWKGVIYQGADYSKVLEVSNMGKIRNIKTGTIYKMFLSQTGYWSICISLGSRKNKKCFKVHKALAESFIPNPNNYPIINHKDGNKLNNYIDNLEWCTYSQNSKHAIENNLLKINKGEEHYISKLTKKDVEYIRKNYIPFDKEFGCRPLARKFNVAHGTIEYIIHGKSWK